MNILLKTSLSSLLAASLIPVISEIPSAYSELPVAFAAENSASQKALSAPLSASPGIELKSENIKFEYLSTVYNGKPQQPKITVSSGGKELAEGTDFAVQYPEDPVNVGLKTVSISGLGGYSGTFSATYKIEALNVSDPQIKFTAKANACTYNGYSQTPDFQVEINGIKVTENDYKTKFSNNINASNKAVCEFSFSGNFTGKRQAEFAISKAEHDDLDIEIPVKMPANSSYKFTYDLSGLLPEGGYFGAPVFSTWDFPTESPTVAFNELNCTVSDTADNVVVSIPVHSAKNFADFLITFYFKGSEKIQPKLVLKPIVHEYDGEPVTEEILQNSGCYAHVNGTVISGQWLFWKEQTAEPHAAIKSVCTFQPDDPSYESVDGVVSVTVNKISAPEISVRLSSDHASFGDTPILTVSGVPEDMLDLLRIEISPDSKYFEVEDYPSKSVPRFRISLPRERGIYTITASLPEDAYHEGASASASINVGNYVPPEQQIPDKVTTADELAALIASAPSNGFVSALGMRSLSEANLRAASQKRLVLEVKLNDTYTWVLQTAKYSGNPSSLDLELGTAVIPSNLIERIGGTAVNSFTVSEKNFSDGTELRITLKNPQKDKFANLFYYSSSGELEFISCARIESDSTVKLPITGSGKYVVITDNETKLFGDINNDCKFRLDDLVELARIYANGLTTAGQLHKHDINGDGQVRLDDLVMLANIYANS